MEPYFLDLRQQFVEMIIFRSEDVRDLSEKDELMENFFIVGEKCPIIGAVSLDGLLV